MDHPVVSEIRDVLQSAEAGGSKSPICTCGGSIRVAMRCAVSLPTRDPSVSPSLVKELLAVHEEIVHCTIDVHPYEHRA